MVAALLGLVAWGLDAARWADLEGWAQALLVVAAPALLLDLMIENRKLRW